MAVADGALLALTAATSEYVPLAPLGTVPERVRTTEFPAANVPIVQVSVDASNVTPFGRSGLVMSPSP